MSIVHADHHDCKIQTNAGTEVEIPTLDRRALPPHLKKKIHIHFELLLRLESMHLMCVRCVQRLERLPTLAALGKGQGKLQGEKWSPLSSYQSLSIMLYI